MRRLWRENSLSIVFLGLFLGALVAQSVAGWHEFNEDALSHQQETISWGRYLYSSQFGSAVLENWQSEYLQFTLYILLTVWFIQKGSPESKAPDERGRESAEDQKIGEHAPPDAPRWARARGARLWLLSNSLVLIMLVIWLGSWFGQSVTGWSDFNDDQRDHGQPTASYAQFLGSSTFWQNTLQNWQSEFLAVGSMAIFSVYLRQRGSPESKPVGAPHDATGDTG